MDAPAVARAIRAVGHQSRREDHGIENAEERDEPAKPLQPTAANPSTTPTVRAPNGIASWIRNVKNANVSKR